MKKLLLLTLLTIPYMLAAQVTHELKTELFGVFLQQYQVAYELIPANGKFGLEAGLIYRPDQVCLDTNSIFEAPQAVDYQAAYISLMISGRYYFSSKRMGEGFYIGPHLFIERWVVYNSEYNRLFTEVYGAGSPGLENPWENVAPGLQAGCKWLLWNRLVLEPEITLGIDLVDAFHEVFPSTELVGFLFLKLGYRL